MAFTQDDLDAIDQALISGELEVSYQDRKVRYRSVRELKEMRLLISKSMNNKPRPGLYRVELDRGL